MPRHRYFLILIILCISCCYLAWDIGKNSEKDIINVINTQPIFPSAPELILGRKVYYKNIDKNNVIKHFSSQSNHFHLKIYENTGLLTKLTTKRTDALTSMRYNKVKISTPATRTNTEIRVTERSDYYKFQITTLVSRTTTELKASGPTENKESEVTTTTEMLASGPTEYDKVKITTPTPRTSTTKMIASGPTEHQKVKKTTPALLSTAVISSVGGKKKEKYLTKKYGLVAKVGFEKTELDGQGGLLLNTPGCKIPDIDPWDSTVANLIRLQIPLKCPGPPLFMKSRPGGSIELNKTILEDYYNLKGDELACTYQSITRKHEDPGLLRENDFIVGKDMPLKFGMPLEEDYVAVKCSIGNETFEHYFPLVRLKKAGEDERKLIKTPTRPLNVILAVIDSVSKLNFRRHFTRTLAFLKEKLSPYEMKGYTKVGDNTFPNLVPLLTGHFIEYYWNESESNTFYFDSLDLIWKDYANRGYRTFYAEDSPFTGTFNYLKRGFYDPPTDYYLRPLALALEASSVRKNSKSHCLHSQIETDNVYDFLRDFIEGMDSRPYIAFAMVSTLTHDYLNNAGLADEPTVRLLEDLWSRGNLNNSALIFFSDHGIRFGAIRKTYSGKLEERMPFMYIHIPKWFLDQHPGISKNLRTNQDRLVTHFDIHATMMHLLDLSSKTTPQKEAKDTLGSSLLSEISPERTCEDANIHPHWCPCQTLEVVSVDDLSVTKISQAVVDDINKQLQPYNNSCAVLEIEQVLDVKAGISEFSRTDNDLLNKNEIVQNSVRTLTDYLITLVTKPSKAAFEATVRYNSNNDGYSVLFISRINMYGNQSKCIDNQKMKLFCYCIV